MSEKKEFMVAWFGINDSAATMKRVTGLERAIDLAIVALKKRGRIVSFRRVLSGGSKPVSWDAMSSLIKRLEKSRSVFDGRLSGYGVEIKAEKTENVNALMVWG